jgi:hypothetical protein
MKKDQIAKLKKERNIVEKESERKEKFHIFSWTLTQHLEDVLVYDRAIMYASPPKFFSKPSGFSNIRTLGTWLPPLSTT